MSGYTGGRLGSVVANIQVVNAVPGDLLTFDGTNWVNRPVIPTPTTVVVNPSYLTGDGTSLSPLGLADSGVVAGSYTYAGINVDSKGRVTTAINGAPPLTAVSHDATLAGDGTSGNPLTVVPGPGSTVNSDNVTIEGDGALATPIKLKQVQVTANLSGDGTVGVPLDLSNTAVTPGTYTSSNITVDAKGRVTSASNGTALSSVATTANLTGDGSLPTPLDLADTAVTPGSYSNPNFTVDAKGRVTAASSGGAALTSVTTTADMTGDGTVGTPLALANSGATAGTYDPPGVVVVNAKGIVTSLTQKNSYPCSQCFTVVVPNNTPTAVTGVPLAAFRGANIGGRYSLGTYSVPVTGYYRVGITVSFPVSATGYRRATINAVQVSVGTNAVADEVQTAVTGQPTAISTHAFAYMLAGDSFQYTIIQTSGAAQNATAFVYAALEFTN